MNTTVGNRGGRVRFPLLFLLLLCSAVPLWAQDEGFPYEDSGSGQQLFWNSVGVGLNLWGHSLEGKLEPLTRGRIEGLDPASVNPLDRVATGHWSPGWRRFSDLGLNTLLGGALLTTGVETFRALDEGRNEDALALVLMTTETALLTLGVTRVTKALTRRIRPYAYHPGLSVEERMEIGAEEGRDAFLSFFSGHASMSFAAAALSSTLVSDLHGRSTGTRVLWASSMGMAGLTAYARVRAGMHFPSDVLVGAVVGTAMGVLVPKLHEVEKEDMAHALGTPLYLTFRVPF